MPPESSAPRPQRHQRRGRAEASGSTSNASPMSQTRAMASLRTGLVRPRALSSCASPRSRRWRSRGRASSVGRRSGRPRDRRDPVATSWTNRSVVRRGDEARPVVAAAPRGSRAGPRTRGGPGRTSVRRGRGRAGRRTSAQASDRRRCSPPTTDTGCGPRTVRGAGRGGSMSSSTLAAFDRRSSPSVTSSRTPSRGTAAPAPGRRTRRDGRASRGGSRAGSSP